MSGRAGRRGKDDRGYAIMLVEDPDVFTPEVAKAMVSGKAMPLLSSFKLSYFTLLNLMKRLEGGFDRMEFVIRHSFQQFQHEKSMPAWQARLAEIEATLRSGGDGASRAGSSRLEHRVVTSQRRAAGGEGQRESREELRCSRASVRGMLSAWRRAALRGMTRRRVQG